MLRDLVIQLDPSARSRERLELAIRLAKDHGARVRGVYIVPVDPWPIYAAEPGMGAAAAMEMERQARRGPFIEEAAAVETQFNDALGEAGVPGLWTAEEGIVSSILSLHGRTADLIVAGQDDPDAPQAPRGMAADVAIRVGRPVLLVPHAGHWPGLDRHALVAWNGSREVARAVHDALPLLARAQKVTVLTVAEKDALDSGLVGLVDHLAIHGIECEQVSEPATDLDIGDVLLARVSDLACDLLVMGAYGHSRIREFVFGGATRKILGEMTVPVLMSH